MSKPVIKKVAIANLILPGDMDERMKRLTVIDMAEDLADGGVGLLERPKVRPSDGRVIMGRDRIAAHMLAEFKEIEVEMVEVSDEMAKKMDLISNAHRRHDKGEQSRLMIDLIDVTEREIKAQPQEPTPPGRGRAQTARGKARIAVAKQLGVKLGSVQKAEARDRKKKKNKAPRPITDPKKPPIMELGIPLDKAFLSEAAAIQKYIKEVRTRMTTALGVLNQLLTAEMSIPEAELSRIYEDIKALNARLGDLSPVCVCPYCKGVDGYIDKCACCAQLGWVGNDGMQAVPAELLVEGPKAVLMSEGKTHLLEDVVELPKWVPGK